MRPILTLACVALLAGTASIPASAQTADDDVKCLLASNMFAKGDKDPQRRTLAGASSLYYFGRVDGRVPPAELKAKIVAQGKAFTSANLGPTMNACAARLESRQKALQALGQQISSTNPK